VSVKKKLTKRGNSVKKYPLGKEVAVSGTLSTHSVWSILPWDVPWDAGHLFFLGLTYLVLTVIGITLAVVSLKTRNNLKESGH
jgi:hypothetical protein